MAFAPDVVISTGIARANVARQSFGSALILSADTTTTHTTYASLDELAADFGEFTPEYRAAAAYFGQLEHPALLHVGKWSTAETRVITVTLASVANATDYTLQVALPDADHEITVTSDGSATNDEVVALLVTALNGLANNNYTAAATGTSGSQIVTVTADGAGDWFEIGAAADGVPNTAIKIKQTNVSPGVATTLNAIANVNDDWYLVLPLSGSDAVIKAVADWTDGKKKLGSARICDVDALASPGASDTLEDLQTAENQNFIAIYHATCADFVEAALAARFLVTSPGERTIKFMGFTGITANRLTSAQRANVEARNANVYFWNSEGFSMLTGGAAPNGEWVDLLRLVHAIEAYVAADVLSLLRSGVKYTGKGILLVANRIRSTLREFVLSGAVVDGSVSVSAPDIADISAGTKATRVLSGVTYSAEAAGSVHALQIKGTVNP
ncbi:MAG: DUF3383 family protein [Desulfurellales bacterium]|nr:MAG: DUF3383 family protein [Desulfurellales bacterium]